MKIEANFSSLKETNFREHLVRFVLGGAVTVAAGLIARHWGPVIGGLFMAFPAIFPAGATLIEEHEVKKEEGDWSRRPQTRPRGHSARCARRVVGCCGPGGVRAGFCGGCCRGTDPGRCWGWRWRRGWLYQEFFGFCGTGVRGSGFAMSRTSGSLDRGVYLCGVYTTPVITDPNAPLRLRTSARTHQMAP